MSFRADLDGHVDPSLPRCAVCYAPAQWVLGRGLPLALRRQGWSVRCSLGWPTCRDISDTISSPDRLGAAKNWAEFQEVFAERRAKEIATAESDEAERLRTLRFQWMQTLTTVRSLIRKEKANAD